MGEMMRFMAGMTKKVRRRGWERPYLISGKSEKAAYDH